MLVKDFKADLKKSDLEGNGEIVGYASTFDRIPDSYGDIVAPGAFTDSLEAWKKTGKPIPLLYGHRMDDPDMIIGAVVDAVEDETGLLVRAKFNDSDKAQESRKHVMDGTLWKMSFAYDVLDSERIQLEDGTEANELRKLDIFEVSLVLVPANQFAEVLSVKSAREEADTDKLPSEDEKVEEDNSEAEDESGANDEPEQKKKNVATVYLDVITRFVKSGRVISKSNEDKLRDAMELIAEVLAQLETDEAELNDKREHKQSETEGDASTSGALEAGAKGALSDDPEFLAQYKNALLSI